jgi:hypothetical protein
MKVEQEQVTIGDWWAPCCVHDLYQASTDADVEEARNCMPFAGAWNTKEEALADLLHPSHFLKAEWRADDVAYAREHHGYTGE